MKSDPVPALWQHEWPQNATPFVIQRIRLSELRLLIARLQILMARDCDVRLRAKLVFSEWVFKRIEILLAELGLAFDYVRPSVPHTDHDAQKYWGSLQAYWAYAEPVLVGFYGTEAEEF